jgi:RHH-type proline utilization regulon transcriptional repressor/proline dehydrogenase/delta 1-pyrroline-5-carboxylate dehydrogenase
MGKSAFGPGLKAGGPNYVVQFMHFSEEQLPAPGADEEALSNAFLERLTHIVIGQTDQPEHERSQLLAALVSYDHWWRKEFSAEHDHFLLLGQDNLRRYLPIPSIRVRLTRHDSWFEIVARVAAATLASRHVVVSIEPDRDSHPMWLWEDMLPGWQTCFEVIEETDAELAGAIRNQQCDRVRYAHASRVPTEVRRAANAANVFLADSPVLAEGRIELLWYVREQSVSFDYHRYGNLGVRSVERRAEPL